MTDFLPKHILVTGGAGFIGCNFVRHMLTKYEDLTVVTLDLLTYAGSLENLQNLPDANRHQFVRGDINDRPLVDKLLREHDIDCIAHFAAESHVDRSITGPQAFMATNILGTYTLLEAARDYWIGDKGYGVDQYGCPIDGREPTAAPTEEPKPTDPPKENPTEEPADRDGHSG